MSSDEKERIARDIENLVEIFNQSDWEEMHLKTDDLEIFLSNDPAASPTIATPVTSAAAPPQTNHVAAIEQPAESESSHGATASAAQKIVQVPDGMVAVTAPNLGTFYRAPKPGAAPYVEVGQAVDDNVDVCLIEVMKLFTPVKAGVGGKIHDICVEDGTMVEFGDVLVIIDPN